ncbi:MAG: right-handed parallel beta-helix repeat-containing protein [Phycisphaerae bacterium]|nr:right-handed parallel beta-helix repeat-containing protein [Phycisphaerae bacterium]
MIRWRLPVLYHVLLSVITAVAAGTTAQTPAEVWQQFWVSPTGSDDNPGTEAKPFATIQRAQSAVRRLTQQMRGDILVTLRGGTYRLAETLVFGAEDSGSGGHDIVYKGAPGETPVVSGGRVVNGWQPDAAGRWKGHTDVGNFRQLYVEGVRARRAQGPAPAGVRLFGTDGFRTTEVRMADWRNPGDIELCFYVFWGPRKAWTHTRCKVQGIHRDGDEAVITMLQPHFTMARTKQGVVVELPSQVENAFELLDEPGEWYLDRPAGVVYYIPKAGQDMTKAEVIAPAIERLVELRGTLDRPVHNIRFEGITFADAGWLRPSEIGLVDVQANFINDFQKKYTSIKPFVTSIHNEQIKAPSNIVCHAARAIRFERCTFTRLGSGGLDLEFGAQDNIVAGCRFFDISGTAIQVGDVLKNDHHPDDPRMIVRGNVIRNNVIHDVGVEFQGSVGIFTGYVSETVIAHNEIYNLPYTGISVGWGWGEEDAGGGAYPQPFYYQTPTPARDNRIEYNHVHHTSMVLTDGGGIYTLSNMPGTVIRGNHIHDNVGIPGGIYLDEGSGFIEVTGNLVYGVPKPMNYNNRDQNRIDTCKVHDNFFDARPTATAPQGVVQIVAKAGLEEAYRDLLAPGSKATSAR